MVARFRAICNCSSDGVSNQTVARASATNSRRGGATVRSTVRRLTWMSFSCASSWRITSAFPRWRRNRSANQSDRPSSFFERDGITQGRQSPYLSQRFTVFFEQPSLAAIRFAPHPNPFRRTIADTSSGVFISSLRGRPDRSEL
jgi:hypothetical protein